MKSFKNAFIILLILGFFSCASRAPVRDRGEIPFPLPGSEVPETVLARSDYLTIIAAGDNIVHDPILRACLRDGVYSFDSIYDQIRGYILPADIAFVNQETILGNETIGYSGYPLFSTPGEAGAALAAAGFNIVNHATNHIMDREEAGVLSSMNYWDSLGKARYLGIHRSEDERTNRPVILDRNNFRIGFLSYTYGTNGVSLPADKSYLVSLINTEIMAKEIDALRPLCDYLVVSMHWGEEYRQNYSANQEKLAFFLAEHKVDLVIGHHPHVLEPFAAMSRPDGGTMTVFYSLGNFLSAHVRPVKEALLGGLMYVKLKKTGNEISTEETGLIPIITHYEANLTNFSIYPLSEYTEERAEKHWRRINDSEMTLNYFNEKAKDLFGPALILKNPFTH